MTTLTLEREAEMKSKYFCGSAAMDELWAEIDGLRKENHYLKSLLWKAKKLMESPPETFGLWEKIDRELQPDKYTT